MALIVYLCDSGILAVLHFVTLHLFELGKWNGSREDEYEEIEHGLLSGSLAVLHGSLRTGSGRCE